MRRRLLAVGLLAAAGGACTFSTERTVKSHLLVRPIPSGFVNSFNLEEQLKKGYVPEVLEFLTTKSGLSLESTRGSKVLGQALLERGDFQDAAPHLERAYGREGRASERGELAWLLSQNEYFRDRFGEAADWGRRAQNAGRRVPEGWIKFLEALATTSLYGGLAAETRVRVGFHFGRPSLIRVAVKINGQEQDGIVLDSGASISLLTDSAAERLGVEPIPDAVASAIGLHNAEFPLRFGLARTLEVGGATLTNVPFGILADEALTFQRDSPERFRCPGVLGVHFMKEFDWKIAYRERRLQAVRLAPETRRGSKGQNIFFRRMKPMVRTSFNQEPWFLFLLDTGSEPTMVTRSGIQRSKTSEGEGSYPMTLEGIGNSRVSWGKTSNATVGVERFMVVFKDLVIKEEGDGVADGVIGSSFLANFDVEMRFSAMTLRLERPFGHAVGGAPASDPFFPVGPR